MPYSQIVRKWGNYSKIKEKHMETNISLYKRIENQRKSHYEKHLLKTIKSERKPYNTCQTAKPTYAVMARDLCTYDANFGLLRTWGRHDFRHLGLHLIRRLCEQRKTNWSQKKPIKIYEGQRIRELFAYALAVATVKWYYFQKILRAYGALLEPCSLFSKKRFWKGFWKPLGSMCCFSAICD